MSERVDEPIDLGNIPWLTGPGDFVTLCLALLYDESIHHVEGNFDSLKELYLEPANATSKLLAQYVAGNAAENTYGNSILKYHFW